MPSTPLLRRARAHAGRVLVATALATIGALAAVPVHPAPAGAVPPDALVSDTGVVVRPSPAPAEGVVLSGSRGSQSAAGAESIIGADNRTEVTDTSTYPTRAIGLITINGTAFCTGFLISRDTVATAGHCVHSGGSTGRYYTGLQFWPGRDGADPRWGSCTPRSGGLFASAGWRASASEPDDYGTIKLSCRAGDNTGWFGLWAQTTSYTGIGVHVQGYPAEKSATQWSSIGWVRVTGANLLFYDNDTTGGMSGSPVFRTGGGQPGCNQTACAAAIHTNGVHGTGSYALYNQGTRITPALADQLRQIATAP